jgi:hypothetical protein
MPLANALNSIEYMDTVLFLTIGKPDIYQLKGLGKSAKVFFRVTKNYQIRWLYIYDITNSREEYCIHKSYRF